MPAKHRGHRHLGLPHLVYALKSAGASRRCSKHCSSPPSASTRPHRPGGQWPRQPLPSLRAPRAHRWALTSEPLSLAEEPRAPRHGPSVRPQGRTQGPPRCAALPQEGSPGPRAARRKRSSKPPHTWTPRAARCLDPLGAPRANAAARGRHAPPSQAPPALHAATQVRRLLALDLLPRQHYHLEKSPSRTTTRCPSSCNSISKGPPHGHPGTSCLPNNCK
mmetsp:Transcript_74570/g.241090  ORF Transcript_74570/g.241090 Transcript_74570/m.241090 type:complete len:220 (-) Transcript_74570:753-1412(-)